jgi:hypothetical protein
MASAGQADAQVRVRKLPALRHCEHRESARKIRRLPLVLSALFATAQAAGAWFHCSADNRFREPVKAAARERRVARTETWPGRPSGRKPRERLTIPPLWQAFSFPRPLSPLHRAIDDFTRLEAAACACYQSDLNTYKHGMAARTKN